jgi:hypothetical protein
MKQARGRTVKVKRTVEQVSPQLNFKDDTHGYNLESL